MVLADEDLFEGFFFVFYTFGIVLLLLYMGIFLRTYRDDTWGEMLSVFFAKLDVGVDDLHTSPFFIKRDMPTDSSVFVFKKYLLDGRVVKVTSVNYLIFECFAVVGNVKIGICFGDDLVMYVMVDINMMKVFYEIKVSGSS